jgi:hypothetical protein
MIKNFKAVVETLSEVGYYLAFCFLVANKTVKIPFKKLASAAEANIEGIGVWMEHAEREAFLARNQSTTNENRIQKLESEILRATYFCLDPRIREIFKKIDNAKITELLETNGFNMDDLDAFRKVKSVFETYVSLLYQQNETLGIDLFASPPIGTCCIYFNGGLQSFIAFKTEEKARSFAEANGLEKPFISFFKMDVCWQPLDGGASA